MQPAIELLVGIPSVVYGFIGLQIVVPFVRTVFGGTGFGILSGIFVLFVIDFADSNLYDDGQSALLCHVTIVKLVWLWAQRAGRPLAGNTQGCSLRYLYSCGLWNGTCLW